MTDKESLVDRLNAAADSSVLSMYFHRDLHKLADEVRALEAERDELKRLIGQYENLMGKLK